MRNILPFSLGLAALAVPAAPAAACSVASTYRVPSNLELAERADVIIVGRAESDTPAADGSRIGEVVFRPVALLKGDSLPSEVRVHGYLAGERGGVVASDPRDLQRPNPGALSGGCTRYAFKKGTSLLLFLARDEQGKLRLATDPFARSAEDVPSVDAPWVRATKLYVEIAGLPAAQREAALKARRDALLAETSDPDAELLAEDIGRQLSDRRISAGD